MSGGASAGVVSGGGHIAKMTGVSSFGASDYVQSANPGGEAGVVGGFGMFLLVMFTSQAVSSNTRILFERQGSGGYSLQTLGTNGQIRGFIANGVASLVGSDVYTIAAGDVNKVLGVHLSHDGSNINLHVNRSLVGVQVPITGYTASSSRSYLGARAGSFPVVSTTVYGLATYRGVLSLAQVQATFDLAKKIRDVPPIIGTSSADLTTNRWSFKRMHPASPPASWANIGPGTDALSKVGSALAFSGLNAPVWGW